MNANFLFQMKVPTPLDLGNPLGNPLPPPLFFENVLIFRKKMSDLHQKQFARSPLGSSASMGSANEIRPGRYNYG